MSSNMVIRTKGLSKKFLVYNQPFDHLKQAVVPRIVHLLNCIRGRQFISTPSYFKEFWALKNIDFHVKRGETIGIIGVNGSGKSTLLQLVCGTLSPSDGELVVKGRIAALLELGAGFNPEFTGRENVFLNAAIMGLSESQIREKFDAIETFADIGTFIDQPVKTYSSGMFVRLAFAVVAHVDADILIIDEALAVGDVFFTQKCMRFLREFKKTGTILFVSHDTGTVVNFCDRAIWLHQGKIIEQGPANCVCEHYLAGSYREKQVISNDRTAEKSVDNKSEKEFEVLVDQRQNFINANVQRNDIEIFQFNDNNRGFGTGEANITTAKILDTDGNQLTWVVGGEIVTVVVEAVLHRKVERLIMGFFMKDRLGQVLFGENTHLSYAKTPIAAKSGARVQAQFTFRMPILSIGSYSADVAIAEGTHEEHVQLDWRHDAFTLQSHSSSTSTGLIGLKYSHIELVVN